MRIAFITPEFVTEPYFAGGLANYLNRLTASLSEFGHEPHIITLSDNNDSFLHNGVFVHQTKNRAMFRNLLRTELKDSAFWLDFALSAFMRIRELHRNTPFDIIQAANSRACGLFTMWLTDIPHVTRLSCHRPAWNNAGMIKPNPDSLLTEQLEHLHLKICRHRFAPSESMRKLLIQDTGLDLKVIKTPFQIETTSMDDSVLQARLSKLQYILFFGRFHLHKGFHILAQALPKIFSKIPELHCVCVGSNRSTAIHSSMKDYALDICKNHEDRIIFIDELRHEQLYPIIKNARFVVLPSLVDNLPNACIESMAFGKIVLGTRGTSFEELITDCKNGFLVPPGNSNALADAAIKIWRLSSNAAKDLGEKAQEFVRNELSPDRTVKPLLEYYREIISAKAGKKPDVLRAILRINKNLSQIFNDTVFRANHKDLMLANWWQNTIGENAGKTALFGAGKHTRRFLQVLSSTGLILPAMVLDDAPQTKSIQGVKVVHTGDADIARIDTLVLSTDTHFKAFSVRCRELYGNNVKLYWPYKNEDGSAAANPLKTFYIRADHNRHQSCLLPVHRITPPDGHYFFGYFDKYQENTERRYLLTLKSSFEGRQPSAETPVEIGMIDLTENKRYHRLGETFAWCWQQGCMLQWIPRAKPTEYIYNDRRHERFIAVKADLLRGKSEELPLPIYAVAPDGTWAATTNFARLATERPGYGYEGCPDPFATQKHPAEDGIYTMDLNTGNHQMIVSLDQLANFPPLKKWFEHGSHWTNHLAISPNSRRLMFLHRWRTPNGKHLTRLFTVNRDGSELFLLNDYNMTSHAYWINDHTILAYADHGHWGYYLFSDQANQVIEIGKGLFDSDGHCSCSQDQRWMLTDTYYDKTTQEATLILYDINTDARYDIGRFMGNTGLSGPTRCDLHPRWSRDYNTITVDSIHEKFRGVYMVELGGFWERFGIDTPVCK